MIYKSRLWSEDVDTVTGSLPELDMLAGKTVFITGASGLICSSVADIFIRYNEKNDSPVRLVLAGRSRERMAARFGEYLQRDYIEFAEYDSLQADNRLNREIDYIIHGAANAFPARVVREPVETMVGNFDGLFYLLDYARISNVRRVLYISSSEVYGQKEGNSPYREDEYGYVDLLNPRNSYSIGKRAAETLCISYVAEYGVDAVIVRPGHIYGPTASENDNRVSSSFAYDAANGRNIVMKSDGSQIRSYCYCLDCASAIIKVLIHGESSHAYNISNPESIITIKEMAETLARAGGVDVIWESAGVQEKKGFNPMSNSSLDSESLLGLGWKGYFDAKKGLNHTVRILKEYKGD